MKSHLYHLQLNIDFSNKEFYTELLKFLGWELIFATEEIIGYKSGASGDLWLLDNKSKELPDYDSRGVNHIAIRVDEQSDIDSLADYMKKNKIKALFGTPKHRKEFVNKESDTYYQVMFKSPDNLLFEVVYIGKKH